MTYFRRRTIEKKGGNIFVQFLASCIDPIGKGRKKGRRRAAPVPIEKEEMIGALLDLLPPRARKERKKGKVGFQLANTAANKKKEKGKHRFHLPNIPA